MKNNFKKGEKVIANLGKKFNNAVVEATFEEEKDSKCIVIRPYKVIENNSWIMGCVLNTQIIVNKKYVL